jgi:hypothetical protein
MGMGVNLIFLCSAGIVDRTVVVSHISRKTSEMWGTRHPWLGQNLSLENAECLLQADTAGGLKQGRVPHISLVFREMWETTTVQSTVSTVPSKLEVSDLSLENAECLLQADTAGGFEECGVAWS